MKALRALTILVITFASIFAGMNLAHARTSKKKSVLKKFDAIVEDGTAKSIRPSCDIESNCAVYGEPATSTKPLPHKNLVQSRPAGPGQPKLHKPHVVTSSEPQVAMGPVDFPVEALMSSPKKTPQLEDSSEYDQVPKDHIDEISERIQVVDQILRKTGKAYDYRSVTLAELKKILQDSDEEKITP